MLAYEYICPNCNKKIEITKNMNDKKNIICHNCKHEMRQIFSIPNILFKGNGFYSTDNKKGA